MATIPGLTTNQWVSGHDVPQGYTLNTPQVYQNGVRGQYYNPQYATQTPTPQVSAAKPGFTGSPGQYRGSNGELIMQPMQTMMPANKGVKPGASGGTVGYNAYRFGSQPASYQGQSGGMFGANPVYSPEMTARSEYSIRANADRASNLPFLMKQFDRPGTSRGAGHLAGAGAQAAAIQSAGREQASNQFLDDYMTNQRFLLDAQMARERERLGLGNVEARLAEAIQRQQLGATSGLLSMLDY